MTDETWKDDRDLGNEAQAARQKHRRAASNGHAQAWRELEFVRARDAQPQLESGHLIKGLLQREQISLLYGPSGCGKTFLAIDRDLSIAAGLPWAGHKVRQGAVVYLAVEAGRAIENRIFAWLQKHGLNGRDIPFTAITSPVDLCHLDAGDVELVINCIQRSIGYQTIALLDIDTVSRALAGGDENGPADMGAFVHAQDLLRSALRCHVGAVHHTGKTEGKGARGHSALAYAVDTEQEVERLATDNGISCMTVKRQRDAVAGGKIYFRLPQSVLGIDEDGDPVTSCVVDVISSPDGTVTADRRTKLSPKNKIALDTLGQALAAHGRAAPPHNHIPSNVMVTDLSLWQSFYLAGTSSDKEDIENRKRTWRRCREFLQAKEFIKTYCEMVWRADRGGQF